MGAFPAYARTVIRNYLLDRCREIQSARKNLPLLSLDAFAEMGAQEPVSPFHTEDLISDVSSDALLSHFKNRYHGTARLGIEAMELRVRGYSCADIAKLYQKKPNYIGACISRAAEKLRRERIVREFARGSHSASWLLKLSGDANDRPGRNDVSMYWLLRSVMPLNSGSRGGASTTRVARVPANAAAAAVTTPFPPIAASRSQTRVLDTAPT